MLRGASDALQHVGADAHDALVHHAESARSSGAEIENAAAIVWVAIVDRDDDAAPGLWVGDANTSAERQGLVRRREPGAATRIVGRHPVKRTSRALSGLRMQGRSRNGRRQSGDCPITHT